MHDTYEGSIIEDLHIYWRLLAVAGSRSMKVELLKKDSLSRVYGLMLTHTSAPLQLLPCMRASRLPAGMGWKHAPLSSRRDEEETKQHSCTICNRLRGLAPCANSTPLVDSHHKKLHFLFLIFLPPLPPPPLLEPLPFHRPSSTPTAILTANSNTSSTPRISLLLHSKY